MPFKDIKKKREYNKERHKKKMEENPDYHKNNYEKIKGTEKYKESHRKRNKKYCEKYPEKVKAKELVGRTPFPKGILCQECKKSLATERHHPDYSKPLYVKFVCKKCHTKLDMENGSDNQEERKIKEFNESAIHGSDNHILKVAPAGDPNWKQKGGSDGHTNYDKDNVKYLGSDDESFGIKERNCIICNKKFKPTNGKQLTCSKSCSKINRKEYVTKNKEYFANAVREYAKKNRKKINAKASANYHIKIPTGKRCQFIDCNELAEIKHHEDYDKPLVVKFYCKTHHYFIHRKKEKLI